MNERHKILLAFRVFTVLFLLLGAGFLFELWGHPRKPHPVPLVDLSYIDTATARQSYADLKKAGADLSDFDCYACHEKGKAPVIRYDTNHDIIVPKEHPDIVMGHGRHNRNNNCFNCHNELNLEQLQTRDGRELSLADSAPLCGSCHGPTYRDWEAGAHGRVSGVWSREPERGFKRQICVSCHNPHSPKFPGRHPAPGPHPLRASVDVAAESKTTH